MTEQNPALVKLREDFPSDQINYLPKTVSRDDNVKQACKQGCSVSADGIFCGAYHARSVHIAYVGHAALTARLLDADPEWSWEPVAFGDDGLPVRDREGGLWIRLTVGGVTRLGYGDAQGKTGPNAVKEAIGDALRNAGMRFGAALTLWSKADLQTGAQASADREWVSEAEAAQTADAVRDVWRNARAAGADVETLDRISVIGRERGEVDPV